MGPAKVKWSSFAGSFMVTFFPNDIGKSATLTLSMKKYIISYEFGKSINGSIVGFPAIYRLYR